MNVKDIPNPWGASGARMNPFLRIAVSLGTGLGVGLLLGWVLAGDFLPTWMDVAIIVTGLSVIVRHLIVTHLWLRRSMKEMEQHAQEFQRLMDEARAKDRPPSGDAA